MLNRILNDKNVMLLNQYRRFIFSGNKPDLEWSLTRQDSVALNDLARRVERKGMIIVEVGSWKGQSASILGLVAKQNNGLVFAVDHFKGNEETRDYYIAQHCDILGIFRRNMRLLGLEDTVMPMIMPSEVAATLFRDESVDLVFLDGDHRYNSFIKDIRSWLPKLRGKGVMCGHDCEGYFTGFTPEQRKQIEEHRNEDYIGFCHPGVVLGLRDYFNGRYGQMGNSVVWYKGHVK